MSITNRFGQPIGPHLEGWVKPEFPPSETMTGNFVQLVALDSASHAEGLFAAFADAPDSLWTYMGFGPFGTREKLASIIDSLGSFPDWQPFCILVDGVALGFASYLRIDQTAGTIEIGSIAFSPALQRTTAATEAIYLMIKHSFELGYRRCEWKCDDLNAPSRSAALRLSFRYEGTFRQATHYKGRNRDTAWYAMTDLDWARSQPAFAEWLSADNFDTDGRQIRSLGDIRQETLPTS